MGDILPRRAALAPVYLRPTHVSQSTGANTPPRPPRIDTIAHDNSGHHRSPCDKERNSGPSGEARVASLLCDKTTPPKMTIAFFAKNSYCPACHQESVENMQARDKNHCPLATRRANVGLTLVELVVTLAVLAILLSIAIPSMQGMIASQQLATNTNDLLGVLAHARMEAIRRGIRITVCKSDDGVQCATSGEWTQGWIAFTDTTRVGNTANVDKGESIIAAGHPSQSLVISGNTNFMQYISYGPDGRSWVLNGTTSQSGILRICSTSVHLADDRRARDLKIIGSGRLITEVSSGVSASCPAP